jgi:hypothetical protein
MRGNVINNCRLWGYEKKPKPKREKKVTYHQNRQTK